MTSSPSQTEEFLPWDWLNNAIRWKERMQRELGLTTFMMPGTIDEVSILFKSEGMLERFLGWAMALGWRNFNSVPRDTARQLYGNSLAEIGNVAGPAFDVRFEFLRSPADPDWRIECMCILEGFAPLHERLPQGACAHGSWKLPNLGQYEATADTLWRKIPKMAEYENSYGRFSYFGNSAPYFKPRVNLRDAETSLPGM